MLYEEPVEIHCITKMWTTRNKITVKKKNLDKIQHPAVLHSFCATTRSWFPHLLLLPLLL